MRAKRIFIATIVGTLMIHSIARADQSFGLKELTQTIDTNGITSIEGLLPLLPKALISSFTMVNKSKSIQEASIVNPRVILFGQTGKLILTFNGDPSQRNYNALEIMSFDEISKKYELREMIFNGSTRPILSEANPKKCTLCHNSNPRPIWDEYRTWNGVFGSNDDDLGYSSKFYKGQSPDYPDIAEYRQFLNNRLKNPRYKLLPWQKDNLCYPYHCDNQIKTFKNSPNTRLILLSSLNNGMAIAQRVSQSPNFNSFKYSLARGLMCEVDDLKMNKMISHILPTARIPRDERWVGTFNEWAKDVQSHQAILNLFGIPYGATAVGFRLDSAGLIDRVDLPEDKEVGPRPVRNAISNNGLGNTTRSVGIQLLRIISQKDEFIAKILRDSGDWDSIVSRAYNSTSDNVTYDADEQFKKYFSIHNGLFKSNEICDDLEKKSDLELNKPVATSGGHLTPEDRPKNWTPGWEILSKSKCIACHDTEQMANAPKIPFGNPYELAKYLHEQKKSGDPFKLIDDYLRKKDDDDQNAMARMPLNGAVLSKKERMILIDYLKWVSEAYNK